MGQRGRKGELKGSTGCCNVSPSRPVLDLFRHGAAMGQVRGGRGGESVSYCNVSLSKPVLVLHNNGVATGHSRGGIVGTSECEPLQPVTQPASPVQQRLVKAPLVAS